MTKEITTEVTVSGNVICPWCNCEFEAEVTGETTITTPLSPDRHSEPSSELGDDLFPSYLEDWEYEHW